MSSLPFPYMDEHGNKALQAVNAILEIHFSVHRSLSTSVIASSMHPAHGFSEETWQIFVGETKIGTRISNYILI